MSRSRNEQNCDSIFSIGVYIKEKMAVLIDSGISRDVAKEIDKCLIQANVQVAAIINTHCHGDHCGGNAFFQHKYPQIKIFSTETERPFIEDPLMAPICFCGGAAAFEELRSLLPFVDVSIIYHGGVIKDLASLINNHEKRILETKSMILLMLSEHPLSLEEITARIMQTYKIPDDLISYALTKVPMQAYIAELERENLVEIRVTAGINRAHVIDKNSTHPSHHNTAVTM